MLTLQWRLLLLLLLSLKVKTRAGHASCFAVAHTHSVTLTSLHLIEAENISSWYCYCCLYITHWFSPLESPWSYIPTWRPVYLCVWEKIPIHSRISNLFNKHIIPSLNQCAVVFLLTFIIIIIKVNKRINRHNIIVLNQKEMHRKMVLMFFIMRFYRTFYMADYMG